MREISPRVVKIWFYAVFVFFLIGLKGLDVNQVTYWGFALAFLGVWVPLHDAIQTIITFKEAFIRLGKERGWGS